MYEKPIQILLSSDIILSLPSPKVNKCKIGIPLIPLIFPYYNYFKEFVWKTIQIPYFTV